MIRSYIDSTWGCEVVLKLERFSYLSSQSFDVGFPIRLWYLSDLPSMCTLHQAYLNNLWLRKKVNEILFEPKEYIFKSFWILTSGQCSKSDKA